MSSAPGTCERVRRVTRWLVEQLDRRASEQGAEALSAPLEVVGTESGDHKLTRANRVGSAEPGRDSDAIMVTVLSSMDPDDLAAVLAHGLAHVACGHVARPADARAARERTETRALSRRVSSRTWNTGRRWSWRSCGARRSTRHGCVRRISSAKRLREEAYRVEHGAQVAFERARAEWSKIATRVRALEAVERPDEVGVRALRKMLEEHDER